MTRSLTVQNATWDEIQTLRHDPVTRFARVLVGQGGRAPAPCEPEYAGFKALADYARAEAAAYRAAEWSKGKNLRQYVADSLTQQWWHEWKGGPLPVEGHWCSKVFREAVDVLFDALNAEIEERKASRRARAAEQGRAA